MLKMCSLLSSAPEAFLTVLLPNRKRGGINRLHQTMKCARKAEEKIKETQQATEDLAKSTVETGSHKGDVQDTAALIAGHRMASFLLPNLFKPPPHQSITLTHLPQPPEPNRRQIGVNWG